jgi:iron complex outermembrane recepter protein
LEFSQGQQNNLKPARVGLILRQFKKTLGVYLTALICSEFVWSEETDIAVMDVFEVTAPAQTFASNEIDEPMVLQQSDMTSVNTFIDNLPGVIVTEGDIYGSDDWSSSLTIRGFQNNLDEQQIGITIDGVPNGNSTYGGGSKANRFIDAPNLKGVNIWQGTADISSRSKEALGGTLDFLTQDPEYEKRTRVSATVGEHEAYKFYVRHDTGEFIKNTRAWLSFSHFENTDWINQAAENERQHAAAKIVSEIGGVSLSGYFSWDDIHEDNYQRVSIQQFKQDPNWDRLIADWTGIPWVDQVYRPAWSTLRENLFTYLRAKSRLGDVKLSGTGYYHYNDGRGDWVPPYITDVSNDGAGGNSELATNPTTVRSPDSIGKIQFVDANGVALAPIGGCVSSITFPYGGDGARSDPACHVAGAIPVGSFRHTHYGKQRYGFTGDAEWVTDIGRFENTLRAGIWYEDYTRYESRDWHKITDSSVGPEFNDTPYWTQYDREFTVDPFVYYAQDSVDFGPLIATFGIRQFILDLERLNTFDGTSATIDSDSDILKSGGLVVRTPIDGLELFGGYAENFAAVKEFVLERDNDELSDNVQPETSTNIDVGLRYFGDRLDAAITYYTIEFENRLLSIDPTSPAGINFLLSSETFFNAGGIESEGIEFFANYRATDFLNFYLSYTHNESTYTGSGDPLFDASTGITPGNTVFASAEDLLVVSANWAISNHATLGGSSKYVGARWLDLANTQRVDGYIVTDLYLAANGRALSESLESVNLQLTVNNILDERYIGGLVGGSGGWLGAPRTAALTLTVDF